MKLPRLTLALSSKTFWIVCAAAVGLLLVLAALLFYPLMGKEKEARRTIAARKPSIETITGDLASVFGEPGIAEHRKRRDELTADYRALLDDLRKGDEIFERWFADVYKDKVTQVTSNIFEQYLQTKKGDLRTALKRKVELGYHAVKDETGAVGHSALVATDDLSWETDTGLVPYTLLPKLQKRYWIREMVVDAVINSGARVARLEDIYFPLDSDDLAFKYEPKNINEFALIQRLKKETKDAKWHEQPLPDNLGETMTFGVSLQIYYADIPRFVAYLLSEAKPHIPDVKDDVYTGREVEKPMVFLDLRGCSIKGAGRGKNSAPDAVRTIERLERETKPQTEKDADDYIQSEFRAKPVRLILTCEVLDFDGKAIAKKLKEMEPETAQ